MKCHKCNTQLYFGGRPHKCTAVASPVERRVMPDSAHEETKRTMYLVASGQISEPELELEVEGEYQVFKGHDAKVFAFGYLTGFKAMTSAVTLKDDTIEQRCGGYERVGWRDEENRATPWATCPGCDDCKA